MAGRFGIGIVVILCLVLAALSPLAAQERSFVLVVVDFQRIVRESDAAVTVREQIDRLRTAYQDEFAKIEEDLRTEEAELTEQRTVVPDEEFVRRRREFEQRVIEAQRQAQYRRAELDRALDDAMNTIQSALLDVVAGIADQQRASVVLNRSDVVMVDQELDFTDVALAELNAVLPHVDVTVPEQ